MKANHNISADINKWIRVTKTFRAVGTTEIPLLYIYGDSGVQGSGWVKNVSLQKGNVGYWTGAATKENILSMINLSKEGVKIKGENISLEGTVTANENFIVNTNGTVKMVNADVSGSITATSGRIGSLTVVGTDDPATNKDDRRITFVCNEFSGTLASMSDIYVPNVFPKPGVSQKDATILATKHRKVGMYVKAEYSRKEGDKTFLDPKKMWNNKAAIFNGNTELFGIFINNTSEVKRGLKADSYGFCLSFTQNNDLKNIFPTDVMVSAEVHSNMLIRCSNYSNCTLQLPTCIQINDMYASYLSEGGDLLIELSIIPHTDNTVPFIIAEYGDSARYRLYKNGVKVSSFDVFPGQVVKVFLSAIHEVEADKNSVLELRAICTI